MVLLLRPGKIEVRAIGCNGDNEVFGRLLLGIAIIAKYSLMYFDVF